MKRTSIVSRLLVLAALVLAGAAPALAADSCTVTVKSCMPNPDGNMSVSAYNGLDASHAIPATTSGTLSWGQSAQVSCNWGYCDLDFRVERNQGSNYIYPYPDACKNATLQKVGNYGDIRDYRVESFIQTCSKDANGN